MAKPKFNFPLSVLLGAARRLSDALADQDYAAAMAERLNDDGGTPRTHFTALFTVKLDALERGEATQKLKTGEAGALTEDQNTALDEMERLMAGARRTARQAFPDDTVKLHSQFQVGIDEPNTLEDELDRAKIILASCKEAGNLPGLKKKGWRQKDTDDLQAAIQAVSEISVHQDAALSDRKGLTSDKVNAANDLYADTLCIQNAARLEYPANKPGTDAARARFLLDTYPPRDRSDPAGGTQTPTAPTTPPSS